MSALARACGLWVSRRAVKQMLLFTLALWAGYWALMSTGASAPSNKATAPVSATTSMARVPQQRLTEMPGTLALRLSPTLRLDAGYQMSVDFALSDQDPEGWLRLDASLMRPQMSEGSPSAPVLARYDGEKGSLALDERGLAIKAPKPRAGQTGWRVWMQFEVINELGVSQIARPSDCESMSVDLSAPIRNCLLSLSVPVALMPAPAPGLLGGARAWLKGWGETVCFIPLLIWLLWRWPLGWLAQFALVALGARSPRDLRL